jgi:hypothetical protein
MAVTRKTITKAAQAAVAQGSKRAAKLAGTVSKSKAGKAASRTGKVVAKAERTAVNKAKLLADKVSGAEKKRIKKARVAVAAVGAAALVAVGVAVARKKASGGKSRKKGK